ncbi:MAG: polysaccharide pyruvyl transferase CsaB [Candidatus Eremiobacteraeota bacterium]|nr:polysaccharide pyruvyl transferase CsaB [Candidatus Eremiobacteraeota bacterium]
MKAARLLLSGYYGFDNFGDDAILETFIRQWRARRPGDSLCVLSAKPVLTAQRYDVQTVARTSMGAVREAMRACDVFVSGGGGLLQSSTSLRGLFYYAGLLHEAKRLGKRAVIFAQGIGPLSFTAKQIVRRSCAAVDLAIVRDESSLALLTSILPGTDVRLGADPVFVAGADGSTTHDAAALITQGIAPDAQLVAVVARPSRLLDRAADALGAAIDSVSATRGVQVVFIPFQQPGDVEASVKIIRKCKTAPVLLSGQYGIAGMSALLQRCSLVVALRLHALILAARLRVPFAALAYDPKVSALLDSLQYPHAAVNIADTQRSLIRAWDERESLSAALHKTVPAMEKRAALSFDWLQSMVEGAVS